MLSTSLNLVPAALPTVVLVPAKNKKRANYIPLHPAVGTEVVASITHHFVPRTGTKKK